MNNFNTTLVSVQCLNSSTSHSCFFISIQHLFRFNNGLNKFKKINWEFQYNTCFGSIYPKNLKRRGGGRISIQHLFRFNQLDYVFKKMSDIISIQHLFRFNMIAPLFILHPAPISIQHLFRFNIYRRCKC